MLWYLMAPAILVGVLSEQGTRVCQKGAESWHNPRFEVGFQRVVFDTPPPKALLGKPVVARVTPSEPPRQAPLPPGDLSCPPMQARSDWIFGMHGLRLKRDGAPPPQHYTAPQAEPFTGLSATAGEVITVTFENTLDVPLKDVKVQLHYEGCYGKPGAPAKLESVGDLAPKAKGTASFPLRMMQRIGRGHEHVPHSVQVMAAGVVMDLDVPTSALGIEVDCESRKRGQK